MIDSIVQSALFVASPPPDLSVSAWADEYRMLSAESSAEPGKWSTSRAPYLRGIMDACSDPKISEIVVMSSAQIGKTEFLLNIIGYYIHQDPSPILLLQPTLDMAEAFSKDRLAPMVRDTPALLGKIADPKSRDSGNTMLHKKFPGGQITMAGANSPASLASRPIRIVLCDEVDRYPMSAGTEGDPVSLAKKRTNTFWNRKVVLVSTPTIAGVSRIEAAFERSDKRKHHVPCPHCGHMHVLEWKNVIFDSKSPELAVMACPECGGVITDQHKQQMIARGVWIASAKSNGIAGFHVNELYSSWRKFGDVASEFIAAKDFPEKLKTWINTSLGEVWEDREGEKLNESDMLARKAPWTAKAVPSDICAITFGADTQDDRLEISILAWTEAKKLRFVKHHVIPGSPGHAAVWDALDRYLLEPINTEDGRKLHIIAGCIDAGGHHAAAVLDFCEKRAGRRVRAIRGQAGAGKPIWPRRASRSKLHRKQQYLIGVDTAKDWLRSALSVKSSDLPHHVEWASDDSFDERYFRQFLAEHRSLSYDKAGKPNYTWKAKPGARVEAWDCAVYGVAALWSLIEIDRVQLRAPKKKEPPPPQEKPKRRTQSIPFNPAQIGW